MSGNYGWPLLVLESFAALGLVAALIWWTLPKRKKEQRDDERS